MEISYSETVNSEDSKELIDPIELDPIELDIRELSTIQIELNKLNLKLKNIENNIFERDIKNIADFFIVLVMSCSFGMLCMVAILSTKDQIVN